MTIKNKQVFLKIYLILSFLEEKFSPSLQRKTRGSQVSLVRLPLSSSQILLLYCYNSSTLTHWPTNSFWSLQVHLKNHFLKVVLKHYWLQWPFIFSQLIKLANQTISNWYVACLLSPGKNRRGAEAMIFLLCCSQCLKLCWFNHR